MEKFVGKYCHVSVENFDAYMKELGVGFALRKIAAVVGADVAFEDVGGGYFEMSMTSVVKNSKTKFKPGVEQEGERPDGKKIKEVITVDDNGVMHHRQTPLDGKGHSTDITRELGDDGILTVTLECNGVVAVRKYRKQA